MTCLMPSCSNIATRAGAEGICGGCFSTLPRDSRRLISAAGKDKRARLKAIRAVARGGKR